MKLSQIFLIFLTTNAVRGQTGSILSQVGDAITSNLMGPFLDRYAPPDAFSDNEPDDNIYNYLQAFKFTTPLLLTKCIKFHDSEIVGLSLSQLSGQWDRHLGSVALPDAYVYGTSEHDQNNDHAYFKYLQWGYHSLKYVRNNTKMVRAFFVVNDFLGVRITDDEAMISIDYDSYFLKYSCMEMAGRVSGTLHFHLKPEATAQLETNPQLFEQILDKIPEKSLNKIKHLIAKLKHRNDSRFMDFGQKYAKRLTQRLEKYRNDNQLSDKTDDQMFQYLNKNCLKFSEEELKPNEISPSNWNLVFNDNNNEKIPFNRITIQRLSENSFNVSLLKDDIFLADSDHYYDPNNRGFWTFTDGMRAFEVILHSNEEHRLTYCCEERQIGDKLQIKEKLRYFVSDQKASTESYALKDIQTILDSLSKLKDHNLNKINQLYKKMLPIYMSHEMDHQEHFEL